MKNTFYYQHRWHGYKIGKRYIHPIDEVTNDVTCLHSGRPLLFYAGENIHSVYDRTHTIILKPYL